MYSIELSANGTNQIFMDCIFAHGYYVKSPFAQFIIKLAKLVIQMMIMELNGMIQLLILIGHPINHFEKEMLIFFFIKDKSTCFLEY